MRGFADSAQRFERAAQQVADPRRRDGMVGQVVQLMVQSRAAEANLTVARAAHEITDCLLHVIA